MRANAHHFRNSPRFSIKRRTTIAPDRWLALGAEELAARAVVEAAARLADAPGDFKLGLVLADDSQGGWTNRFTSELALRFPAPVGQPTGWLSAVLWTGDEPAAQTVTEEVLSVCFRAAYLAVHGPARTLREMLAQEGRVMASSGCTGPVLAPDQLARTREIIALHLDALATDLPTVIPCLFGDEAAVSLGYTPLGLPERAGLALALHDARAALMPSPAAPTR